MLFMPTCIALYFNTIKVINCYSECAVKESYLTIAISHTNCSMDDPFSHTRPPLVWSVKERRYFLQKYSRRLVDILESLSAMLLRLLIEC